MFFFFYNLPSNLAAFSLYITLKVFNDVCNLSSYTFLPTATSCGSEFSPQHVSCDFPHTCKSTPVKKKTQCKNYENV